MRQGLAVACSCALLVACARARAPQAPSSDARPASAILPAPTKAPGPRLFPPTRGAGIVEAGVQHDGSRRLLALGLRVIEHPDGSLEVGDELLPAARSARFLELPERLGGGFLFWIVTSSATLLYRAQGWTAKLEPLAQLDFEVERLVPGFDRLLLLPRRDADYRALDLESGKPVPPLGLPVAPAYGNMAFVDGWFGAVQVPLRGVLLSFDAGASWHPLALPVTSFEVSGAALSLTTPTADYALDARGVLSHVADRDEAKVSEAARAELARVVGKAGARPGAEGGAPPLLEIAALTGFPDGRGGAFVATAGSVLRLDLTTGRVLERRERAYAGAGECQGVRFGTTGVGFVCGQAQELTRLYRVTQPLGLEPVLELPGARVVSDSGSGGLVIHGPCLPPANKPGATGTPHCVLPPSGAPFEVRTFTERDRVVALADGRAAVVTPPDRRAGGSLRIEGPSGATTVPFRSLRQEPRQKKLLEQGVWLDGMVEAKAGVLSGWVVGAGPFAGVELGLDGKLTLRRIQDDASHTLFAGPRALVLGENGLAQESTDAGAEWQGVELPPELDLKSRTAAGAKQGCTALGCAFAGLTRIGYFAGRSARSLAAPAAPPRVSFPGPGGSRWLLRCAASGEVSAPALPARAPRTTTIRGLRAATLAPGDEPELPPLSPLLDQAPPALSDGQQGVDAGTEPYGIQTRIYAYGPRGGDWTKTGSLSISFADRFSVKPGVRTTAAGRSPWPDATSAADALGAEPSTSSAGFAGALDPSGSAGALLLNSRGSIDLFVFESGRVPLRIANVGRYGMAARFAGVVRTKAGFFLGSYDENSRAFRIYRVVGQELDVVLEVTDIPPARGPNAEVVRTAAGDALGIWVRGTGWFVHPLDLESRTVDAPYQVTPAQLSTIPEACESGAEGFVLSGAVTPDPYAEMPSGMSARGFEGRFRVSATSVCLDALAAQGEAGMTATPRSVATSVAALRATGRPTVALTLTERKPLGRRMGLVCSN
jgi:hypothetical protein